MTDDREQCVLDTTDRNPGKHWLRMKTVHMPGVGFPAEVVARSNGQWIGQKAIPLFIEPSMLSRITERGYLDNVTFFEELKKVPDEHIRVLFLKAHRPIYFFPWPDDGTEYGLRTTAQVELPGGIQEPTEKLEEAAIAELIEETGIGINDVLAWSEVYPSPSANDSGTHVERYGMWYVLVCGTPKAPSHPKDPRRTKEGIEDIILPHLRDLRHRLLHEARSGVPIDIMTHLAVFALEANLKKW